MTPWIIARQFPFSMEFPRQEYWSGLPFPTAGDLPNLGLNPRLFMSPALADGFFTTSATGKPCGQNQIVSLFSELNEDLFNIQAEGQGSQSQAIMYDYNKSNRKKRFKSKETQPGVRFCSSLLQNYPNSVA